MSTLFTKLHKKSVKWFQRICEYKLFWYYFNFGQISKFKRGLIQGEKIESEFPAKYVLLHFTECKKKLDLDLYP